MKHILATEQKKTDFKPEDENNVMIQYTTVSYSCKIKYIFKYSLQVAS